MKNFRYIVVLSCLWLTACTQDNDWLPQEPEKATIHLNLQSAEISVDTRSTTPQDPQTDNPMYTLHLLHYNSEGQLIKEDTKYKNLGAAQLTYIWSPQLSVKGGNETICLVANMNEQEAPIEWPDRLADLKEACARLKIGKTGLIENHKMYMFGYYEGPLKNNQSINIMMGRMAAALKFVISTNNHDVRYRINKIEIQKASRDTYYFPHKSEDKNFDSDIVENFSSDNDNNVLGTDKASNLTYYYQVGENIAPTEGNRTRVVITAEKGIEVLIPGSFWPPKPERWEWQWSPQTYTVILGCDAPGTPDRNYSLYRNNNYTFNIALN